MFDTSEPDPREHFLASLVVAFLSSPSSVRDNDGFVRGADALQEMLKQRYSDDQCRSALRRLALKRLIETPHAHYREISVADYEPAEQFHYRATSIGIYHVRFWMGNFGFLDAMSTDTPIFKEDARREVFNMASSFDIRDRYWKSEYFRRYLEDQWHLSNITASYFDFSSVLQSQAHTFEAVKNFIERPRPPFRRR